MFSFVNPLAKEVATFSYGFKDIGIIESEIVGSVQFFF